MKKLIILILLLFACTNAYTASFNPTCILPKDKQIWPLPKPNSEIQVNAIFQSREKIAEIIRGDEKLYLYFVEYKAISINKGIYEPEIISFIFYDSWPTNRFIRLKKLDIPFIEGSTATFWINKRKRKHEKREGDGVPDLWDIQTYEIKTQQFHRKPQK